MKYVCPSASLTEGASLGFEQHRIRLFVLRRAQIQRFGDGGRHVAECRLARFHKVKSAGRRFVQRRYHESVIEWRELRNKVVRECLVKAAQATTLGARPCSSIGAPEASQRCSVWYCW